LFQFKICFVPKFVPFLNFVPLKKIKNITKVRFFKNKKENTKKKPWKKTKKNHEKKRKIQLYLTLLGRSPTSCWVRSGCAAPRLAPTSSVYRGPRGKARSYSRNIYVELNFAKYNPLEK
jgi:hypothetical protein